jgi:hypothetical protein
MECPAANPIPNSKIRVRTNQDKPIKKVGWGVK